MSNSNVVLTADSLLAYEPFLRAVARGLLSDEHGVQDLVQETWVRALESPPRKQSSLKSWLASVARNIARNGYRGEGRRKARELVAARPEQLDVEASCELLETHRRVVDGVLALEEPYKSVVILTYYQGLSPGEIAERLDRKPATVRSQLHRAHGILRSQMDAEFGGDRGAWAALLMPLASLGSEAAVGGTELVGTTSRHGFESLGLKLAIGAVVVAVAIYAPQLFEEPSQAVVAPGAVGIGGLASSGIGEPRDSSSPELPGTLSSPIERDSGAAAQERTPITGAQTLTIEVLKDGVPQVDAEVWYIYKDDFASPQTLEEIREMGDWYLDPESLFARFGRSARTNDEGELQLEWDGSEGGLLAYRDEYQAIEPLTSESEERVVLELVEVSSVAVEVVDFMGEPVLGVPVSLCVEFDEHGQSALVRHRTESARGQTIFRNFREMITGAGQAEARFSVGLAVPGAEIGRVPIDPGRGARNPIRLLLEPTSPLKVRVVDAEGRPKAMDGKVSVYEEGLSSSVSSPGSLVELRDGVATFPHIALNTQLEIVLDSPSLGPNWTVSAQSSRVAGELRVVDAIFPSNLEARGRVLDPEGQPMAFTTLYLCLCTEQLEELKRARVRTDAEGRFQAQVGEEIERGSRVLVRILRYGKGWDGRSIEEPVVIAGDALASLGDFTLVENAGKLKGRCVSPAGEPIAGLRLQADQDFYRQSFGATTDKEGRFEMHGLLPKHPVLSVTPDRWVLPEGLVIEAGPDEVQIVMVEGGVLTGSLIADESLGLDSISVVLSAEGPAAEEPGNWKTWAEVDAQDASFVLRGIPTGTYALKIWSHGQALARIGGIDVVAANKIAHPALQGIDLRGGLVNWQFKVEDQDGNPIQRATARVYSMGELVGHGKSTGAEISVQFAAAEAAVVLVTAHGFAPARIPAATAPSKVILLPGIPVSLHTQQRPVLAKDRTKIYLSLVRFDVEQPLPADAISLSLPSGLTKNGHADVIFPEPGLYRLYLSKHTDLEDGMAMASVAAPVPGDFTIEVRASDAGRGLEVGLPESVD
jgi:RNA polymerase sigma-70 factor (ECF subfamily)